tara:strand:+ start:51504 stop:52091 length:588 start_codon:yes stop_codon:yes gene_type:complete
MTRAKSLKIAMVLLDQFHFRSKMGRMRITRSDISRVIDDPAYYKRGVAYFSRGKVSAFQWEAEDRIVGRVSGSGGRIYSVDVTLRSGSNGHLSHVHGHCACPVGFNCKHVVAILLEAARRSVDAPTEPAATQNHNGAQFETQSEEQSGAKLPVPVSAWLDRFSTRRRRPQPGKRQKNPPIKCFTSFGAVGWGWQR